jgi:hypothetical protein
MAQIYTINLDLFPTPNELNNWISANSIYYAATPTLNSASVQNKAFIDVDLIPPNNLANWLQQNGDYISYIESNATIEAGHIIAVPSAADLLNVTFVGMRWANLKTTIDIPANQNYKKYIVISVDTANNRLSFSFNNRHSNTVQNLSLPFFNSVVAVNRMTSSDSFEFAIDKANKLIFRVKTNKYYNITNVPM